MSDSQTRLIETAVRPLGGDAEMKLAASYLLGELVKPDCEGAEETIARWDAVDGKNRRPVWRWVLWILLIAVSAGVAVRDGRDIVRYVQWVRWSGSFSLFSPEPIPVVEPDREYTARQRLLLFGDPAATKEENAEALWRSEPGNPAFLAEYGSVYSLEHDKMPADFLESTKRLDPENAWFTYLAAAVEAKGAVKAKSRKSRLVGGRRTYAEPKSWEILDQGRLDRSLELIREAGTQAKWEDYAAGMLRERISLLPQRNFIERINLFSVISSRTTFSSIRLRMVSDVIATRAWSCGEAGDLAGFQETTKEGERFLRRVTGTGAETLVNEMIVNVCAATISESFADAAGKFGLVEESDHWGKISKQLRERSEKRYNRSFIVDGKAVNARTVTGILTGGSIEMVAKQAEHQPPLTDEDLKPGRLLDHEISSRFCCYISWILMAGCLGAVAAYQFRVPAMSRRLARRMEKLLGAADWTWMIGAGVLLPFAFVMMVNRLTPLGGRQFGILGNSMLLPAAHFLGLFMLWLVVPPQIVGWRMAKRAGVFGFPKTKWQGLQTVVKISWLGWLVVICTMAFVPVIGWVAVAGAFPSFWFQLMDGLHLPTHSPDAFWIAILMLGVSLLWVLFRISSALLSGTYGLFHRATASFLLVRVYAVVMLVLALATVGFKACEQYWFDRDMLSKPDASEPGWSHFEYRVAVQMRKETRETLGY